ncbi:hypothetical protein GCM10022380_40430 [Amycolatopsis tucumanensis]|uniref:Uncharacterized protein n=1 Tax=Amycolatopsis tucumanensis TaxID=401106 RepID=A0ABP7IGI8_9PSEU
MPLSPALPNGVRTPSTKATVRTARAVGARGVAATMCSLCQLWDRRLPGGNDATLALVTDG